MQQMLTFKSCGSFFIAGFGSSRADWLLYLNSVQGFFNTQETNHAKTVCLEYLSITCGLEYFSNVNFMSWYLPKFSEDTLNFLHSNSVTFPN